MEPNVNILKPINAGETNNQPSAASCRFSVKKRPFCFLFAICLTTATILPIRMQPYKSFSCHVIISIYNKFFSARKTRQ